MIVKESNKDKINAMIKEVEGRSTARTIDYRDIVFNIATIERTLGIPKKYMVGIEVNVDKHAQDFPNAYKYTPYSTQYTIKRKASGWDLISVKRNRTRRLKQEYLLQLTDTAKEAIIKTKECFR